MASERKKNSYDIDLEWLEIFRRIQFSFIFLLLFLIVFYYLVYTPDIRSLPSMEYYYIFYIGLTALSYFYLSFKFDLGPKISLSRSSTDKIFPSKVGNKFFVLLGFFTLVVLIRLMFHSSYPLTSDELSQHRFGSNSIFLNSLGHQQPAGAYILSFFSVKIFGYTEFGIRATVYGLGAMLSVYFYCFLRVLKIKNSTSLLVTLAFSLNPVVFQYGITSRPISLGLIFCLFVVFEYLLRFSQKESNWKSYLCLLVFSQFFLVTLGFQPPIFILSIFFVGFFLYFKKRDFILKSACILVLSLFLFFPLQLFIAGEARAYLSDREILINSDFFARILNFSFDHRLTIFSIAELTGFTFFIILMSNLLKKTQYFKKNFEGLTNYLHFFGIFLLALSFTYLILARLIFISKVQWYLSERYLILYSIPLFLSIAMFVQMAEQFSSRFFQAKKIRFPVGTVIIFIILAVPLRRENYPKFSNIYSNTNATMKMILSIEEKFSESDAIIPICLSEPLCWDYPIWQDYLFENKKIRPTLGANFGKN
jgi:hypothetical protein